MNRKKFECSSLKNVASTRILLSKSIEIEASGLLGLNMSFETFQKSHFSSYNTQI